MDFTIHINVTCTEGGMQERPLTSDDYADAAKTISKCPGNRLLIVLELYRKAGLDIQIPPVAGWIYPKQLSLYTAAGSAPGAQTERTRKTKAPRGTGAAGGSKRPRQGGAWHGEAGRAGRGKVWFGRRG